MVLLHVFLGRMLDAWQNQGLPNDSDEIDVGARQEETLWKAVEEYSRYLELVHLEAQLEQIRKRVVSTLLAKSVRRVHFIPVLQGQFDEAKAFLDVHTMLASLVECGFLEATRDQADVLARGHEAMEGWSCHATEVHPVQQVAHDGEPEEVFSYKPSTMCMQETHVMCTVEGESTGEDAVRMEGEYGAIVGFHERRQIILFYSLAGDFLVAIAVFTRFFWRFYFLPFFKHQDVETEVWVMQENLSKETSHKRPLV
ncbi:hypothetical protein GQ600_12967 [Phytophthora cactorum]|nr:hypothetical protein GQ600_12967 [Phytophthora cactorum]